MALLAATPLVYVHGVDAGTWREVWGVARPADVVWGGALGTGVGAWFGAVPIPLDWCVSFLPSWVMVIFVLLLIMQGPAVASIPDHYPYRGVSGLCGWIVDLSFVVGVWEADPVRAG